MNPSSSVPQYSNTMNYGYNDLQGSYNGVVSFLPSFADELAQMEQSLAQMYKDNITLMTQSLEQYKNEMIVFQKKYDMLREDYQYNLRVIKERDDELRKCDNYVTKMKGVCGWWKCITE